jgi:glycosyltransferase involved in cell wall biosynthesis
MNYKPLGTRAMDHFILEYDRQAKARGWDVCFGFTAEPPAGFAHLNWNIYNAAKPAECGYCFCGMCDGAIDIVQTSFHSAFEEGILEIPRTWLPQLVVIDHSSGVGPSPRSWLTPLRKWRGRRVGKLVDAIVCVSEYNARRATERVFLPTEKVHVVPNGIDLARFPMRDREPESLRILFVGQLIREKGVRTLLDAARLLTETGVEFLIAGQGDERGELERAAPPNVRFLGQVADVAALYASATVVVVPSLWAEAFGLVVIEAMACGAVVVASDAGALPEVVGEAGLIFPKGNAIALAATLRSLLQDESRLRQLSTAGRRRVEERYQLAQCVRSHLDIVDQVGNQR